MNFLRFRDLKQRGVVFNWTTLARLIREQGFPPGTRIGAQARAWAEDEVEAWLQSRRIAAAPRDAQEATSISNLPTIGREHVREEPAHVVGVGSAQGRHKPAPARSTPPPQPRSLATSNESNPRR
jgi:predicted DNA-binding transcriptional regulator AlpA